MSGDLHCHTRLSDGSMGIEDLIVLAQKKGIETIAITDHDCLAGTVRGKIIGDRSGVKVIPGVELSAVDHETGRVAHLLCYLPEFPDRLEGLCRVNQVARKRAAQYMMIKAGAKFPITNELVIKCASGSTNIYKQHIMHALMECGLACETYGEEYNRLFHPDSGECIYVKPPFAAVEEVLQSIHAAGGIAVLAHPVLYDSFDLLERLIPLGLNGVEVWHPTASREDVDRLIAIAKKHKLLMTGGSDFHGMYGHKGTSLGSFLTPKTQLNELLAYKSRQKRLAKKAAEAAAQAAAAEAQAAAAEAQAAAEK